jgi:hypothetical protein
MKTLAILALVLVQSFAMAQDVPAKVKEGLKKKFPAATNVEWSNSNGNYEGEFYKNDMSIIGIFDENGTWLKTKKSIDEAAIPASVSKAVMASHKEAFITNQFKIENSDGSVNYEVTVGTDLAAFIYLADATGGIIKTDKEVFNFDAGGDE